MSRLFWSVYQKRAPLARERSLLGSHSYTRHFVQRLCSKLADFVLFLILILRFGKKLLLLFQMDLFFGLGFFFGKTNCQAAFTKIFSDRDVCLEGNSSLRHLHQALIWCQFDG